MIDFSKIKVGVNTLKSISEPRFLTEEECSAFEPLAVLELIDYGVKLMFSPKNGGKQVGVYVDVNTSSGPMIPGRRVKITTVQIKQCAWSDCEENPVLRVII